MNDSRFDALTKALATPTSRRQALKTLGVSLVGGILGLSGIGTAFAACKDPGHQCSKNEHCCSNVCCDRVCCASGQICQNGICVTPCTANGGTCSGSSDCCSGNCSSGLCCPSEQTNCNGTCVTCPAPGVCAGTICCQRLETNCGGVCCRELFNCCPDGTCCDPIKGFICCPDGTCKQSFNC